MDSILTRFCAESFDLCIKFLNEAKEKGDEDMARVFLAKAEEALKDGIPDHQFIIDRVEILRQRKADSGLKVTETETATDIADIVVAQEDTPESQPKAKKRKLDESGATKSKAHSSKATAAMLVPKGSSVRPTDKAKPHVCPECGQGFVQKQKMEQHVQSKHRGQRVKCEVCEKTFAFMSGMKAHMKVAHKEEKYICDICEREYRSYSGLNEHKKTHGEVMERFKCEFCDKSYTKRTALREHIKFNHTGEEKEFTCSICSSKFTRPFHLKQHIEYTHDKAVKFPCGECGFEFFMKKTLVKHNRPKKCKICKITINCTTKFSIHQRSHIITCFNCKKGYSMLGKLNAHAYTSHVKWVDCTECSSQFTAKGYLTGHMVNVHNKVKCPACPQTFADDHLVLQHCKQSHAGGMCLLCVNEPQFVYFSLRQLAAHISEAHSDRVCLCKKCGTKFSTVEALLNHTCSKYFVTADVKLIALVEILQKPFDPDTVDDIQSEFCDTEDLITQLIPGLPLQSTCSIDNKLNHNAKQLNEKNFPLYVNQSQALIKNGSRTLLVWCPELNSLSYCCELLKFERLNGIIVPRPKFDRSKLKFHRDANDTLFNIRTSTLEAPYDLGHAHAAANCWTLLDYFQSFSNLNYWAMYEVLNRNYWCRLERAVRESAMRFEEVYVTTGAVFRRNGKITTDYVRGIIIPEGFFKIAFFKDFDGSFDVKAWVMRNDDSVQNVDDCEVSVLLIEKLTTCYYLNQQVLAKVKVDTIKRHLEVLRRHDTYFGVR